MLLKCKTPYFPYPIGRIRDLRIQRFRLAPAKTPSYPFMCRFTLLVALCDHNLPTLLKVDRISVSVSAPKVTEALTAHIRFRPKAAMPFSMNFWFWWLQYGTSADIDSRSLSYMARPLSHHQCLQLSNYSSMLMITKFQVQQLDGCHLHL